MRPAIIAFLMLLSGFAASPAYAQQSATASVRIEDFTAVRIVQDVLSQTRFTVTLVGRPGDAVSLAIPGSVSLQSDDGQLLRLSTITSQSTLAGGMILSGDTVSVNVAPALEVRGDAAPGTYKGLMMVVAQYN